MYLKSILHTKGNFIFFVLITFIPKGKGGKFCHFRVHVLPDNYVCFESVQNPGQYLNMGITGVAGDPRTMGINDMAAQFFVRIEVRLSMSCSYSS